MGKRFEALVGCNIIPYKWLFTILAFAAIFNSFTMRSCLTVAITSMVVLEVTADVEDIDPNACQYETSTNETSKPEVDNEGRYTWSQSEQGLVLGAYYIGYALTNVPGAILADIYGAKMVQAVGAFIYAGLTVLTPQIIQYGGVYGLSAARIGEGLADGVTFPCINIMVAEWIPPHQKSSLGAMIFSGCLLGSVIGSTLSGSIIATFDNWELVFYFFGSVSFIWLVLWMIFVYNSPFTHPYMTDKDREVYRSYLGEAEREEEIPPIPWKAMMTSVPLWALLTAQIGSIWLFSIIGSTLAKYLNDVLKFSVAEVGLYSGLPFLFMWISSTITGYVVDIFVAEKRITTTNARKVCVTSASFLPAIFILVASYCGCNRNYAVVVFSFAMGCMGPYFPGIKVNPLDLSPNYSGLIMAIINATGAVISVITPLFVTWMTPNSTIHEWRNVFWITFFILLCTGSVFSIFASGEIQDWNYSKDPNEDNEVDIINKKLFFAIMAFTGILNSYAMRSCLTVALTSMTVLQVIEEDDEDANACVYDDYKIERSQDFRDSKRYNWSQDTQGMIIGSYYIGYAVSNVPGAILADRYGGKVVEATGMFILTTFTILTPFLVKFGEANALVGARIIEGLGDGVTFPSISIMIADWIPPHQISTLGSMIFSGMLLGSSFGQAVAGFIIGITNDWTIAFYLFGIISYAWLTLWVLFIFNSPSTHPFISDVEQDWLKENLGEYERGDDIPEVPWGSIFTSVSVWSLLIAQAGVTILLSVAGVCLPKYLSDVLRFSVSEVGFYSAVPYLAMWLGALVFAHVVNTFIIARMITVTTARKWCNTTGTFLPAICIMMASYFRCNRNSVVLSFTAALGFMGAYFPGILVNPIDLSPNYAGYIMALMNVVSAGISAGTPYVIGLFVPNASILEWRHVFWITFFIALTTGCIYLIFGSAEMKDWNFGKITESEEFLPKLYGNDNLTHGKPEVYTDSNYKDAVKFDSKVEIIVLSTPDRVSVVSSMSSSYVNHSVVEMPGREDSGTEVIASPTKRDIHVSENFSDMELANPGDTTPSASTESTNEVAEKGKEKEMKEADESDIEVADLEDITPSASTESTNEVAEKGKKKKKKEADESDIEVVDPGDITPSASTERTNEAAEKGKEKEKKEADEKSEKNQYTNSE